MAVTGSVENRGNITTEGILIGEESGQMYGVYKVCCSKLIEGKYLLAVSSGCRAKMSMN
jgi:hypothetical protein